MDRAKIKRLRRQLESLRAGAFNLKPSMLIGFAESVGRTRANRGKEPTYVSILLGRNPLSIPGHSTINGFTAKAIIKVLEADLDVWESLVEEEEKKKHDATGISPTAVRKSGDPR
jgi:hypothetical protein